MAAADTIVTDDSDYSARVKGQMYSAFIANFHAKLKPTTYFEIGTLAGGTLKLAKCASIAVDPQFHIASDVLGSSHPAYFSRSRATRSLVALEARCSS